MPDDESIAADLISGSLKRSKSYHADYGDMTYKEIKELGPLARRIRRPGR